MKKTYSFLILILFSYYGFSQSVEAESGDLYRGATLQSCGSCSNMQQVGDIGFNGVDSKYFTSTIDNVATNGLYTFTISYASGNTRNLFVSANGATPVQVALNSGDWGTVATHDIVLRLHIGTNTIKFYNDSDYAPNIDKFSYVLTKSDSVCTDCYGPFEAESGVLSGAASIQSCSTCSNDAYVGDMGYSDRFFTKDVTVSTAGKYRVYVSYSSGTTRNLSITANGSTTVSDSFNSGDWGVVFVKSLDIDLNAGTNSLKFHTPGDWSPNVDKFRLELLDNNADLADLKVNGITVSGFNAAVSTYNYPLTLNDAIPQITFAETANTNASRTITQGASSSSVKVTSSNGLTTKTYTVNYVYAPLVVEAESGKRYNGASEQNCGSCSNSKQVGDIGYSNYFTSKVNVPTNGVYTMTISFASGDSRNLSVTANGTTPVTVNLNSGDWGTVATSDIQLNLHVGTNTIKFYNDSGYAPNIDKFSLTLLQADSNCVDCYGPFEAESGVVNAPATIQTCNTCSGNSYVGDMGYNDRYFTKDVTVAQDGTYRIFISAASGSTRNISVTAGSETASTSFNTVDWDVVFVKSVDIYLNAGTNSLKFHTPGDWSPNVDKFRLELLATSWTGASNNSWTNGENWTNGVPTSSDDVEINSSSNQPVISSNVEIYSLDINSGASMIVNSGNKLTVEDNVNNDGTLTIANNANLIQINNIVNTGSGTTTINRNGNLLTRNEYILWSSPVENQNILAFSPVTLTNRFYNYNETNNKFTAIADPGVTAFAKGAGYLIRMPNSNQLVGYNTGAASMNYPGQFTGTANNGNISKSVNYSGTAFGYNLVGNPYPSTINANSFIAENASKIESSLYFWRKVNGASGTAYAVYNAMGSTNTPSSETPNGTIQVGQGFFVKAKSGATTIDFTNAMRTGSLSTQIFKTKENKKDRIWLNLTNTENAFSQTLIGYTESATSGLDDFDAKYINDSEIALTSNINGEEFTIQGRPSFDASDVVALNFKTDFTGSHTIALDHFDGIFAENQSVYLVDQETGAETDLKNSSYTFNANAGTNNTRFTLKYQKTLNVNSNDLNSDLISIIKNNNSLTVASEKAKLKEINVYTIQGKLIDSKVKINDTKSAIKGLISGQVYIIKITDVNNVLVTKKVLL